MTTATGQHEQFIEVELLITEVEKRPCLWDTRITEYTNKFQKQQAWCEVCGIVIKNYDQLSTTKKHEIEQALKRKWKGIRSSFSRELRRLKSTPSGSQRKSYVYFDRLNFLKPVATNKRAALNVEMENEIAFVDLRDTTYMTGSSEEEADLVYETPRKRKTNLMKDKLLDNLRISLEESNEKEDEDRHFFLSLVPEIKKVPADHRMDCKLELMSTIRRFQRCSQ